MGGMVSSLRLLLGIALGVAAFGLAVKPAVAATETESSVVLHFGEGCNGSGELRILNPKATTSLGVEATHRISWRPGATIRLNDVLEQTGTQDVITVTIRPLGGGGPLWSRETRWVNGKVGFTTLASFVCAGGALTEVPSLPPTSTLAQQAGRPQNGPQERQQYGAAIAVAIAGIAGGLLFLRRTGTQVRRSRP
jgi:hypothetical protein